MLLVLEIIVLPYIHCTLHIIQYIIYFRSVNLSTCFGANSHDLEVRKRKLAIEILDNVYQIRIKSIEHTIYLIYFSL